MSKFTDSIKGFVNKHFTGEVTCSHCGKTGKIMFFSKLNDGNMICSDCKDAIPEQFKFKPKESSLGDYKKIHKFLQRAKNELEPIFQPDESYSLGQFKVDPIHKLCRIGNSFVFEISNVLAYNFVFKAEDFKEGFFSSKVKGDIVMAGLVLKSPVASFDQTVLKRNAKGKAEKPFLSSTVIYDNPKEMDEFVAKFESLFDAIKAEEAEKEFQDLVEKRAQELIKENQANN